jgi:hypothetical protein
MQTPVPEKLLNIVEDIDANGSANLTRLTVLKKWFDRPERKTAYALWVADRATSRKGNTSGDASQLFREARQLLKRPAPVRPEIDRAAAQRLHERLRAFQNEYRHDRWGDVRVVHNSHLLLVEKALAIYLDPPPDAADCYKLAADYCQNYDPKYGNSLNGLSSTKIVELVRFLFTHEALEDSPAKPRKTASSP